MLDGRTVWALHATHGLPLEVSLEALASEGIMVSWFDLLAAAHEDGAKWATLIPRLCEAIKVTYPHALAGPICARLSAYHAQL